MKDEGEEWRKEYASGEELDILRFLITAEMRLQPLTSGDIFEASLLRFLMKEVGHHQAGKECLSRSSVSLRLDDLRTPHRGDYASAVDVSTLAGSWTLSL